MPRLMPSRALPRYLSFMAAALLFIAAAPAYADPPPPQGAKPLSEILRAVEAEPDFRFIDEVEWDDGRYEVEYYTQQGSKRTIYLDPMTGEKR